MTYYKKREEFKQNLRLYGIFYIWTVGFNYWAITELYRWGSDKTEICNICFGLVVSVETAYRRWAAGHHVTPCAIVMFRNH